MTTKVTFRAILCIAILCQPFLLAADAPQTQNRFPKKDGRVPATKSSAADRAKTKASGKPEKKDPRLTTSASRFRPPSAGAPDLRVSGGSRGTEVLPTLVVLAPRTDEAARTMQAQPTLYCYASSAVATNVEFTIALRGRPQVILETNLVNGLREGVNELALKKYGVQPLLLGEEYQWSVAHVLDPNSRSLDVLAKGFIRRVPVDEAVTRKISQANEFARPSIYESERLWYDAADSLLSLLQLTPADEKLQRLFSTLVTRAALPEVKWK